MLDLKAIREDPEAARKALSRRGVAADLDRVLELDEKRRSVTTRVEALRAEQNRGSKAIGAAEAPDERQRLIEAVRSVSEELERLEPELARLNDELQTDASRLPNIPDETTPD